MEESLQYFFYPEENMLYDEAGYPVYMIYQLIPPSIWKIFKMRKDYYLFETSYGYYIELFYVENENL